MHGDKPKNNARVGALLSWDDFNEDIRENEELHRPLHEPIEHTNDALMASEIAHKFIEWRSSPGVLTESKPFKWLQRLAALGRDNPDALWLYLQLQTGDLSALTDTYDSQAQLRLVERQMIHKTHKRALLDMAIHFPELQSTIQELDKTFRPPRGINRKTIVKVNDDQL
jgi:hypothetical protein